MEVLFDLRTVLIFPLIYVSLKFTVYTKLKIEFQIEFEYGVVSVCIAVFVRDADCVMQSLSVSERA